MKVKKLNSPRLFQFDKNKKQKVTSTIISLKKKDNTFISHVAKTQQIDSIKQTKKQKIPISIAQFKIRHDEQNPKLVKQKKSQFLIIKQQLNIKRPQTISQLSNISHEFGQIRRLNSTTSIRSHNSKRRSKYFLNLSIKKQSEYNENSISIKYDYVNSLIHTNNLSAVLNSNNDNIKLSHSQTQGSFCDSHRQSSSKQRIHNHQINNNCSISSNNKYEYIRSTMRKMKNLSQIKLINKTKKSNRMQTCGGQEWSQIQRIVGQVCGSNNIYQNKQDNDNNAIKINGQIQSQVEQQRVEQQSQLKTQSKHHQSMQQVLIKTIAQQQPVLIVTNFKDQKDHNINEDRIQFNEQQQILSSEVTIKNRQLQLQQQKQNKYFSQQQFNSLIVVFQHILNDGYFIVDQVTTFCNSHKIQARKALFLFVKQLYLNRKVIQIILSEGLKQFHLHKGDQRQQNNHQQANKFTEILKQITQDNAIFYSLLCNTYHNQKVKIISLQNRNLNHLQVENEDIKNIDYLKSKILEEHPQYVKQNLKILKKILKKLSKESKTNQHQFHLFINYASSFINLLKVNLIVQKITFKNTFFYNNHNSYSANSIFYQQSANIQQQLLITKQGKKQFLQKSCGFINIQYIQMQQHQFINKFQNQVQHKKIESYYHLLIKQLKSLE